MNLLPLTVCVPASAAGGASGADLLKQGQSATTTDEATSGVARSQVERRRGAQKPFQGHRRRSGNRGGPRPIARRSIRASCVKRHLGQRIKHRRGEIEGTTRKGFDSLALPA